MLEIRSIEWNTIREVLRRYLGTDVPNMEQTIFFSSAGCDISREKVFVSICSSANPIHYAYGYIVPCCFGYFMSFEWIDVIYLRIYFRVVSQHQMNRKIAPVPLIQFERIWKTLNGT